MIMAQVCEFCAVMVSGGIRSCGDGALRRLIAFMGVLVALLTSVSFVRAAILTDSGHEPATAAGDVKLVSDAGGTMVARAIRLMGTEEIFFVERGMYPDGHYYRNFSSDAFNTNRWMHPPDGSRLCVLNLRTKVLRVALEEPKGDLRDPRVSYDGRKFLFAWRRNGAHNYNLWEMNVDGTGRRQLSFGTTYDDFGAEYLPDGGIIFVSDRSRRFVPCNECPSATLFRMDADGGNILSLSANNARDDRPAVLPSGQIVYDRWEYVDASIVLYHDLWTMNPDGTQQLLLYGGSVRSEARAGQLVYSKCDPMPIPGSDKLVCVFSPPHGLPENAGDVAVINVKNGPDAYRKFKIISPERDYDYRHWYHAGAPEWFGKKGVGFRDPYALSENCFFAAENEYLWLLDGQGGAERFHKAAQLVHDPRPLTARPREPVIASRLDLTKSRGTFVVTDVYKGRPVETDGLARGTIKKLLIMEDLPKCVSAYGMPFLNSIDGSHTLRRVIGEVPVEADGSAAFTAPALCALYFVALDAKGLAVKRMQSFAMTMPGETQSCIGCHEDRTLTQQQGYAKSLLALRRPPSVPGRPAGTPEIFDYPRDIQPILDNHCVKCHNPDRPDGPAGRVNLNGDRAEWFSQSYYSLYANRQVKDMYGRYANELREHGPYEFGSGASPLMGKLAGGHHGVKVSEREWDTVRLWIEASCTFWGTLGCWNARAGETAVAGCLHSNPRVRIGEPIETIVANRCFGCHDSAANLGRRVRKSRMNSPKHCWNLYNLSHPEKSMILLAPLARESGGWGWCKDEYGQPNMVFRSKEDADYRKILAAITAAKGRMDAGSSLRPDEPGFVVNPYYVTWMKLWGILPSGAKAEEVDPYEWDRVYWEALRFKPVRQAAD